MTIAPLPLTALFEEVMTHALWHHAELECDASEIVALHEVIKNGYLTPFRQRHPAIYDIYTVGEFILYMRPDAVLLRKGGAYIGVAATCDAVDMRLRTPHTLITPAMPIAMIS